MSPMREWSTDKRSVPYTLSDLDFVPGAKQAIIAGALEDRRGFYGCLGGIVLPIRNENITAQMLRKIGFHLGRGSGMRAFFYQRVGAATGVWCLLWGLPQAVFDPASHESGVGAFGARSAFGQGDRLCLRICRWKIFFPRLQEKVRASPISFLQKACRSENQRGNALTKAFICGIISSIMGILLCKNKRIPRKISIFWEYYEKWN